MREKPLWKRALGPPYRWLRSKLRRLHPRRVAAFAAWVAEIARSLAARRREPRLTVAVDVAAYWEPLTGVGWYLDRVLRELADRDDLRLRLYGEDLIDAPGVPRPAAPLPRGPAIEAVRYPVPDDMLLPPGLAARVLRRLRPALIAADRNRLVFAPNFYPPRRFQPALEIGNARLVATIHDLAFHHHAWTVGEGTLDLLSLHLDRVLRDAAQVITPSEAVRRELAGAGLAPIGRIRAIHHGPGQLAGAEGARRPAWAPERYALFVGTLEPRKNVETLLDAWRGLRSRRRDVPDLVLCGRLGWKGERLVRRLERGRDEGWLHQPGYVADDELAALYRDAVLLAFPSHYEGFGLPLLEALAAGTPVVASDIPVLREVAGEAALYAPPARPDLWADRIGRLLDDPAL
ncbi:MAG: glycosyltransferase family 1 protein, partial [Acidobacteriota bacterium]